MNPFLCGLVVRPVTSAPACRAICDREHADAAGRALDQHAIAFADARHLEHRELRGEVGDGQRRARGEVDRRGQLEHLARGDRDVRRVAAEVGARDDRDRRARDRVTFLPTAAIVPLTS